MADRALARMANDAAEAAHLGIALRAMRLAARNALGTDRHLPIVDLERQTMRAFALATEAVSAAIDGSSIEIPVELPATVTPDA